MCKQIQGMHIDDNQLAKSAYRQSGPGQNFLSAEHTLKNFESVNYKSDLLANTQSFEQWTESGSLTAEQRANQQGKAALESYQDPGLDAGIDEALRLFIEQKKNATTDQWY